MWLFQERLSSIRKLFALEALNKDGLEVSVHSCERPKNGYGGDYDIKFSLSKSDAEASQQRDFNLSIRSGWGGERFRVESVEPAWYKFNKRASFFAAQSEDNQTTAVKADAFKNFLMEELASAPRVSREAMVLKHSV